MGFEKPPVSSDKAMGCESTDFWILGIGQCFDVLFLC